MNVLNLYPRPAPTRHPGLDRSHVAKSIFLCGTLLGLPVLPTFSLAKEIVVNPANVPSSGEERQAFFDGEVDVGACRLRSASVTIRRDGSVTWKADVASLSSNNSYCTRLIFIDRHKQRLFTFPFICSQRLTRTFNPWERTNLSIPEHIFPNVRQIVRNDKC
jgi:hypothetical protein